MIIPDTNALYAWPDLDKWKFDDCARFVVVLVPALIREIDEHKDDARKTFQSRRAKAEKHVRQIKGYRERAARGPTSARWRNASGRQKPNHDLGTRSGRDARAGAA